MSKDCENAQLSDKAIARVLLYKHGWKLGRQRVFQIRKRAERKIKRLLESGKCPM